MTYALSNELTWVAQYSASVELGAPKAPKVQAAGITEHYELTWAGKVQTKQEVQRKLGLTLAPVNTTSESFADARHLIVSGESITNLQVLQRSVLGMGGVKLALCQLDGRDLARSLSNLTLIRPLLRTDGCCFIWCPDASALAYARLVGDEVLGAGNFIATLVWQSQEHTELQYLVLYARTVSAFSIGHLPRTNKTDARYKNLDHDPRGSWTSSDITVKTYNAACDYPITTPSGRVVYPPKGRAWSLNQESFEQARQDNRIWFGATGGNVPRIKRFLSELKREGLVPTSLLLPEDLGESAASEPTAESEALTSSLTGAVAERLLRLANLSATEAADDVVLVVGTSAACETMLNTVATLNELQDSSYRCLLLPQESAALALSRVPVRELMAVPDPYAMWALPLSTYSQESLASLGTEPSQDSLALLFAYLARSGCDLTQRCSCLNLEHGTCSYQVLTYAERQVWLCAEPGLSVELVAALAAQPTERQPQCLLCCDLSFASDAAKINFLERCATLLPQLAVKVI